MITISLCMIVKNEEDVLDQCLASIAPYVEEINIVDTGSTDRTKEIAQKYTSRIFDFTWVDDFAAARNASFSHATQDYVLWLDADDVLLPEDGEKLLQLKTTLSPEINTVNFYYNYAPDANNNPTLLFRRERLVKRSNHFKWVGFIHEYIATSGPSLASDITVTHKRIHNDSDRNINIYEKKLAEGVTLSTRDVYYYGKELFYHDRWEKAIEVLTSFLPLDAWVEDKIDACNKLGMSYFQLNQPAAARQRLYQSFEYAPPRGEAMYRIGKSFQDEGRLEEAVFWYEACVSAALPTNTLGFVQPRYWRILPALEACVCYYRLGNISQAKYFHERCKEYEPAHPSVLFNEDFFKDLT